LPHFCPILPPLFASGEFQHRGGFASYIRTPASKVLKIPAGLDPAEAAPLLCAGVTTFTPLNEFSGALP